MSTLQHEYREFRARGGVVDLTSRTKLLFTGADRVRYINGQVTANIAALKPPAVAPACVTTAKGKLSAEIFVTVRPNDIVIDADSVVADVLPPRLEKYIIADDVTMEEVTDKAALFHLLGVPAEKVASIARGAVLPNRRFGMPGWDLLLDSRTELAPIWNELAASYPVLSETLLELIRIEQGVPRWGFELGPDTLPAEAGLDRSHVDFHKGCYIGQEVISRVKSVGHVNRKLSGFTSKTGQAIPPGAKLFHTENLTREIGQITSSAFSFALDRPIALGYLRRGAPAEGLLAMAAESPDAPMRVTLHPLPFLS